MNIPRGWSASSHWPFFKLLLTSNSRLHVLLWCLVGCWKVTEPILRWCMIKSPSWISLNFIDESYFVSPLGFRVPQFVCGWPHSIGPKVKLKLLNPYKFIKIRFTNFYAGFFKKKIFFNMIFKNVYVL